MKIKGILRRIAKKKKEENEIIYINNRPNVKICGPLISI